MKYQYIIKYAGEIGTKSRYVRKQFISRLSTNIQTLSNKFNRINQGFDRLYISLNQDISNQLSKVPGIAYFARVEKLDFDSLDDVIDYGYSFFRPKLKGESFAVECKRTGKNHNFSSMDVARKLGAKLDQHSRVDLDSPDYTARVEIKNQKAYFFYDKIKGMGGLPLGVSGYGLSLISGGIDSIVACYKLYRTGIDFDFVTFDLGGQDSLQACLDNVKYIYDNYGAGSKANLYYIDFSKVLEKLMQAPKAYRNLMLKYSFYKIANRLADQKNIETVITGESIGQVSTQTLVNLTVLDKFSDRMVLRPLLTDSKNDIMDLARKIGTYEKSYKGKEYCALTKKGVKTQSKASKIQSIANELELDSLIYELVYDVLDLDLSNTVQEILDYIRIENYSFDTNKSIESLFQEYELIDIRTKQEYQTNPIKKAQNIPYEELINTYRELDKTSKYCILCKEGRQSNHIAKIMKKQGFEVVTKKL